MTTLTKRQANYIWYCIGRHEGLVYHKSDWLDGCDISEEEFEEFEKLVQDAIESITAEP